MQRQLEALGAQRAGLEDMLKEMKRKVFCLFDNARVFPLLLCASTFSPLVASIWRQFSPIAINWSNNLKFLEC